jgi:hypothetical protein
LDLVEGAFSVREGAGVALEGGLLRGKSLMAIDAHGADRILIPIAAIGSP